MKDTRDILMKKDPQYVELQSAGGRTDQSPGPLISRRRRRRRRRRRKVKFDLRIATSLYIDIHERLS